jgi:hypothetical protein
MKNYLEKIINTNKIKKSYLLDNEINDEKK